MDRTFLDKIPDDSPFSVRTALKNVIANSMVIWMKHDAGSAYLDKDEAYRAIHSLDVLTPVSGFVPPLNEFSSFTSRRKRKAKDTPAVIAEVVYSDGEIGSVKL